MFDNISILPSLSALSGIFGVLCIVIGSGTYVATHLDTIPVNAIEILGWVITSALTIWPLPIGEAISPPILAQSPTPVKLLLNFLGVIFLPAMITLSLTLHSGNSERYVEASLVTSTTTALVSGLSAFLLQSEVIGFYSVISFFTALHFSSLLFWDYLTLGNDSDVQRYMLIAGLLLNVFIGAHIYDLENQPWFRPFKKGVLIWGGLVYFTGGMFLSSLCWRWEELSSYVFYNFLTAGSLLAIYLLLATVPNLHNTGLSSVVNVFICLYTLEKFADIAWSRDSSWPIAVTLCGTCLFSISLYLRTRTTHENGTVAAKTS